MKFSNPKDKLENVEKLLKCNPILFSSPNLLDRLCMMFSYSPKTQNFLVLYTVRARSPIWSKNTKNKKTPHQSTNQKQMKEIIALLLHIRSTDAIIKLSNTIISESKIKWCLGILNG